MSLVESGNVIHGPEVELFEQEIARFSNRKYAVAVGSGTDALFFLLAAAGLGPGDDVIVPAFSFVASASAVLRIGARPKFCDVVYARESQHSPFGIDLDAAERLVSKTTRAMVWVGLYGGLDDQERIERFARAHNLVLLEDAAQSFGAAYNGRPGGSLGIGSAFSFDRTKVLGSLGTGGAVVSDEESLADRTRSMRWHGMKNNRGIMLGYNSQLPTVSAVALNVKLKYHDAWTQRRREIAHAYDSAFANLPLIVPAWPAEVSHSRHKYVILTPEVDALQAHLNSREVPSRRHYDTALPDQPLFRQSVAEEESFPNARRIACEALSLPIHAFLDADAVSHIVSVVTDFRRGPRRR